LNFRIFPQGPFLEANWFSITDSATLVPSEFIEKLNQLPPSAARASELNIDPHYAVHLHAHYKEEAIGIIDSVAASLAGTDFYITYSDSSVSDALTSYCEANDLHAKFNRLEFIAVPNQGRNVTPLFRLTKGILQKYSWALHLHTKKSPHFDEGNDWSKHMIASLVDNMHGAHALISQFADNPRLGLVMPTPCRGIRPWLGWGSNLSLAKSLALKLSPPIVISETLPLVFPAGMMFWFRPFIFSNLSHVFLNLNISEPEPLLQDGTSLHAVERLLTFVCESRGFGWAFVAPSRDAVALASPYKWWQQFFRPLKVLEPCPLKYKFVITSKNLSQFANNFKKLPCQFFAKAKRIWPA
jgi:lipopolysaccharide biosynthesis protein